jgi:hypothetical protein
MSDEDDPVIALADVLTPEEAEMYELLADLADGQGKVTISIEELTRRFNAARKKRSGGPRNDR